MENIIKCSHPKMTGQNDRPDESLTGQAHDQARHCPLTGCYFEPWSQQILLPIVGVKMLMASLKVTCKAGV